MLHLRKFRQRSLLALIMFICLSAYLFIIRSSPLFQSSTLAANQLVVEPEIVDVQQQPVSPVSPPPAAKRRKHQNVFQDQRPLLQLDPIQELAAISSFLASLPQNVIPSFVNPARPIDPELVLDFDAHSPRALDELNRVVGEVWSRNPVFLYCKLYSPLSRELKAILDTLRLVPAPTVIDVDIRDDSEVLRPMIHRLTSTTELPVLLIGGKSVGSMAEIRALHKSGELQQLVSEAGAVINGAKRRKHGH
ncbi:hypothetical protein C8J56DRAFT_778295 [Mycena floridula]|nr:hypothetical protein C8J56DRAFT_778295 [Mycena floridula]